MTLEQIVEESDYSTVGRVFDSTIQVLVLLSLVSFSIETLPGLDAQTQRLLRLLASALSEARREERDEAAGTPPNP